MTAGLHVQWALGRLEREQDEPGDEHEPEPAQLIEDAVQQDAAGRLGDRSAPAADDDPEHGHVPRPERDAGADPGQDEVRLEAPQQAKAGDEGGEDRPGQDPGDEAEDRVDEEVLEGEALERCQDVLVVDEPRHDDAEDDRQHAEHEQDPQDRIPLRVEASSPASPRSVRVSQARARLSRR